MTKQKWYFYTIKETRKGDEKVRNISSKSDPDKYDEILRSKIDPKTRKEQQELYDEWNDYGRPQQGGSFGDTYSDLLRVSQKGGQNSSRRIWKNEAEKQRAKRAKKDLKTGKELTPEQTDLLIRAGVITKESDKKDY